LETKKDREILSRSTGGFCFSSLVRPAKAGQCVSRHAGLVASVPPAAPLARISVGVRGGSGGKPPPSVFIRKERLPPSCASVLRVLAVIGCFDRAAGQTRLYFAHRWCLQRERYHGAMRVSKIRYEAPPP
jgi:hypothetical protein